MDVVCGTGPLGLAVMRALRAKGGRIRMVSRSGRAEVPPDVEIVAADVSDRPSARRACFGAAVVYLWAMAPYAQWPAKLPAMMAGIIEGAASAGARLVYGDNLPLLRGRAAQVLGNPNVPHTYTFIDDFARALVTLGERAEAVGQVWHVPSAETLTTRGFVEVVCAEAGVPLRLAVAPRPGIALLALFDPTMRAVKSQLYESEQPFVVDHSKYARVFGDASTPHGAAIRATLDWYRGLLRAG